MLGTYDPIATIAVGDLGAARAFYEGVLGLQPYGKSRPGTAVYRAGSTSLLVYVSDFAGTNRATAVTWRVRARLRLKSVPPPSTKTTRPPR